MSEKNELNDIILNKSDSVGVNKKIILSVATLGVILIVVIMLVSTLTQDANDNLPQPTPPPQEEIQTLQDQPLFEEVVEKADVQSDDDLDIIAQRLKQESLEEKQVAKTKEEEVVVITKPKSVVRKPPTVKKEISKETSSSKEYYIQVGSFSKYTPNKKFLNSIARQGYKYKFHKVTSNSKTINKVLVGPFYTEKDSREALRVIKSNIEANAFLIRQ